MHWEYMKYDTGAWNFKEEADDFVNSVLGSQGLRIAEIDRFECIVDSAGNEVYDDDISYKHEETHYSNGRYGAQVVTATTVKMLGTVTTASWMVSYIGYCKRCKCYEEQEYDGHDSSYTCLTCGTQNDDCETRVYKSINHGPYSFLEEPTGEVLLALHQYLIKNGWQKEDYMEDVTIFNRDNAQIHFSLRGFKLFNKRCEECLDEKDAYEYIDISDRWKDADFDIIEEIDSSLLRYASKQGK